MHSHPLRFAAWALPNILPNVCAYQPLPVNVRKSSALLQARAHRLTAAYPKFFPPRNSAPLRFSPEKTSDQAHTLSEILFLNKKLLGAIYN